MNIDKILLDIVSALMLPAFVVMILCGIAGAKPEPIIKGLLDLIGSIVALPFKAIGAIWDVWREERRRAPRPNTKQEHVKCECQCPCAQETTRRRKV